MWNAGLENIKSIIYWSLLWVKYIWCPRCVFFWNVFNSQFWHKWMYVQRFQVGLLSSVAAWLTLNTYSFCIIFQKSDFTANQTQTETEVPRQTHFAAQTPVWRRVIDSTPSEHGERHNQTLSQEAERVHATQSESATSAKWRETREHTTGEALTLQPSTSPPEGRQAGRQWDGNAATVYGSRNKLLVPFLELSHD